MKKKILSAMDAVSLIKDGSMIASMALWASGILRILLPQLSDIFSKLVALKMSQ